MGKLTPSFIGPTSSQFKGGVSKSQLEWIRILFNKGCSLGKNRKNNPPTEAFGLAALFLFYITRMAKLFIFPFFFLRIFLSISFNEKKKSVLNLNLGFWDFFYIIIFSTDTAFKCLWGIDYLLFGDCTMDWEKRGRKNLKRRGRSVAGSLTRQPCVCSANTCFVRGPSKRVPVLVAAVVGNKNSKTKQKGAGRRPWLP